MKYSQIVIENQDYALAKKAKDQLSHDASRALNSWEHMNWDQGTLSNSFETNDAIAKELYAAFEPVRQSMKQRHGETIKLYRGIQDEAGVRSDRKLFSWTSSLKIAKIFAGQRPDRDLRPVTDDEIKQALDRYKKTGFTTFRGRKFKINKQHPQYYDMYNKHNNYITDGDNLERDFRDVQATINRYIKDNETGGRVVSKEIKIDNIVWVLMGGNANEYIVSGHSE